MNRNLLRGFAFLSVALYFGIQACGYRIGNLAQAGPGLFPAVVSAIVGVIGIGMIAGSFIQERKRADVRLKSIGIVLGSLIGFALLTKWAGALPGVAFLVFFSALANEKFDWKRNVKITLGLMAITYLFTAVLGVSLRLY
ncbi:tripartite tricarboxylate transporter TctB family protein [Caballeronia sp. AZ7_KS35]|uniref:tripartite tricarboxylate transporter TctB family protein n=1 Tax=Caballeronia sp. AZ7_KS35 TaxID=2921762 RepID=UPI002029278F|nr:tripartite tricarboxylate transporter TctB family protein [Caballeronia sp. AZ7_KS35]